MNKKLILIPVIILFLIMLYFSYKQILFNKIDSNNEENNNYQKPDSVDEAVDWFDNAIDIF